MIHKVIIILAAVWHCIEQGDVTDGWVFRSEAPVKPVGTEDISRELLEEKELEPCRHRDSAELEKQLEKLRKLVVEGDSSGVNLLLKKWSANGLYVHNLKNLSTGSDYPEIHCSDLDFLARHDVQDYESAYDHYYQTHHANIAYMTILELALHMTRGVNERALTKAMAQNELDVGEQGERTEERINIIRLLLEKGFLWGSGDLVCRVVPKENGYRKVVREAFARTILHDLVRDKVHMNRSRITFLRNSCGDDGMDGVVWIMGSAPGAFTLLGLFSQQTVLMTAAQDNTNHDEALINFPELIRLHTVLQAPITTVDLHGWNAEMLAARALKVEHVELLQQTTVQMWQQKARDAFSILLLGEFASDQLSSACISLILNLGVLAHIGLVCFMGITLFAASLFLCKRLCKLEPFDPILSWIGVVLECRCTTFLGAETILRVLWLLTLNTAFLNLPPEFTIAFEKNVSPFAIPSVSKWNPLPATVHVICFFCILMVLIFGWLDYWQARHQAGTDEKPAPAAPEDRYQDPACHLIGCVCVFGLMTLLMIIYVQIVLRPMEMDPKKMGLWFGSLLVQIKITTEDTFSPDEKQKFLEAFAPSLAPSQGYSNLHEESVRKRHDAAQELLQHWHRWAFCMVTPFNTEIWHLLMFAQQKRMKISREDSHAKKAEEVRQVRWSRIEITLRFVMSYVSNGLYKAIIVYTLPLWLCRGGLTDFVLNAFATVYIVELDDLTSDDQLWKLLDNPQSPHGSKEPDTYSSLESTESDSA